MSDIKKIAKELCTCHHKCHDTTDCVVEDEAELLLINENKSNNFEVKSNNELFKQALVEGVSRHFDKIIEQEKQIEEMAEVIFGSNPLPGLWMSHARIIAEDLYNEGWRKQSEWISVEDRLPELEPTLIKWGDRGYKQNSVRVLCTCRQESGKVLVKEGYYQVWVDDKTNPYWKIPGSIDSVTHWMPLPEAPKMKGGEE